MGKIDKGGYADARYHTAQVMPISESTLTVAGTAASATELSRITAMTNIRALDINVPLKTGGTAAGPTLLIGKSAAGTGTFAAFGTIAFGTQADNTVTDGALTETQISAGDDIIIQVAAGTAASTPVADNVYLQYVEDFVSA